MCYKNLFKKMTSRLPFKTNPKAVETCLVGDSEIGELEIRRLNDLSPNERIFLREQIRDLPDLRTSAVKMARAIADKSGMRLADTYNALTRADTDLLGDYLEEVMEFQSLMERVTERRRVALATAILRYRLVPEWTIEDSGDADQIHPKLVEAIADFAQKEESGWAEPEATPVDDEALGKSSTAEEETQNQTGQQSSGDSLSAATMTPDSVQSSLVSSPAG